MGNRRRKIKSRGKGKGINGSESLRKIPILKIKEPIVTVMFLKRNQE